MEKPQVSDTVKMPFTYSAEATRDGIRLTISREVINFVKETIPDGQMAGMIGHRPVHGEHEFTFDLHPAEARALWEELGRALHIR